ncbi:hypothetical protein CFC21_098012 [Triticum aestivum]|uniref:Uncharacterized protein n=2 Tax=Triticum aestivum TaxID=4565 RepID=A0A3B6RJT8_WHEAT|nr:hypothetical protein CFC21_098012 [Triticum aestivum]
MAGGANLHGTGRHQGDGAPSPSNLAISDRLLQILADHGPLTVGNTWNHAKTPGGEVTHPRGAEGGMYLAGHQGPALLLFFLDHRYHHVLGFPRRASTPPPCLLCSPGSDQSLDPSDESVDEAAASPLEGDGGGGAYVRLRLQPPLRLANKL